MPGRAVAALPALRRALDCAAMRDVVARAASIGAVNGFGVSAEIVSLKPGQRCTIAYTLQLPGARIELIGKLYGRPRLAARVFAWMQALGEVGRPARVPRPCGLEPLLGLVLQERAHGLDLRHVVSTDCAERPLALAAGWLARLHGSSPLPDLRVKSLAHELRKLDAWTAEVAGVLTASEAARLEGVRRRLHELAATMPPRPQAMVHRDFYYAHVLWDGSEAWILDLDQLGVADPALDVAHFLAHLDNLALRTAGSPHAYRTDAAAFLAAYAAEGGADVEAALPFYRAYTHLKLAATEAERRRGRWLSLARELVVLAYDEAVASTVRGPRS